MPDLDLGDVTIHYEETGSGPLAYVFCHGGDRPGMHFVDEFPFWKQHFPRVITWDHRGQGLSTNAAKYSVPLYASDLARLLDHLGVRKAVVHGFSWGGLLVQQFALDYPDKCAAIIIDSSSSEVNAAASEKYYSGGERARLAAQAAQEGGAPSAQASQPGQSTQDPAHVVSQVAILRAIAGTREHPYTPRLKYITCPALVVGGGKDGTAGAAGSVVLSRALPNARLQIFQDAGHGIYKEEQTAFRALVLEFSKDHGIIKK